MKRLGILLFLLILGACGGQTGPADPNFRTGSQGLQMQFLPSLPPPQLYDDQSFDVTLQVSNVGATDVGFANDRIYLSGFDHRLLPGISFQGQQLDIIEGKDAFNLQGTLDYVSFQATPLPLIDRNVDRYKFSLLATACYGYETIASGEVCIDTDPFATTSKQKVCTPAAVGFGTQGGPIAVGNVQVEPSPRKTRFKIAISNVGGGDVFREGPTFLNKCSPYDPEGLRFDDVEYVALEEVRISDQVITSSCKPLDNDNRHIKLINGNAMIHCELDHAGLPGNYVTPLIIRLRYGYRNILTQPVEVLSSQ